eukprot:SAG22_NODE_9984_length_560_cov_0.789588_1_plen_85_part_10
MEGGNQGKLVVAAFRQWEAVTALARRHYAAVREQVQVLVTTQTRRYWQRWLAAVSAVSAFPRGPTAKGAAFLTAHCLSLRFHNNS